MKEFILKRKKLFIIIGISILFIIILGLILTSKPVVNKFEMYKFKKIVNKGVETGELYYSENKDNLKDLTINLPEENIIKEKSLNGKLVVTKDGKTALAIHDNKYCAIKSVDEEEIKINSDIENCVMPKTSISELNVNLESENECIKYNVSEKVENAVCPVEQKIKDGKCYKDVTHKETVNETRKVTYYRYRLRSYIGGVTDYKWCKSKEDKELLNAGYKLTGKTREVK